MNKKGFYVIGGQHNYKYYGYRETLHAAKLLAAKNIELFDNWQGLKKPSIYAADDCIEHDGNIVPKPFHAPLMVWTGKKWEALQYD